MSGQEGWYALQNIPQPSDSLPVFGISDFTEDCQVPGWLTEVNLG